MSAPGSSRNATLESIERLLFGSNSLEGTMRIFGIILAFVVIAGSIFHFTGA